MLRVQYIVQKIVDLFSGIALFCMVTLAPLRTLGRGKEVDWNK